MNPDTSLARVTTSLEVQILYHREQEALHAERERFHGEKRGAHTAELEQLTRSLDALRSAARRATELADRDVPIRAVPVPGKTKRSGRTTLHQAVKALLKTKGAHEIFGAKAIAAEVNQHFRAELRRPVSTRQTSVALRWLAHRGWIVQVRKGRPFWEGQYTRQAVR